MTTPTMPTPQLRTTPTGAYEALLGERLLCTLRRQRRGRWFAALAFGGPRRGPFRTREAALTAAIAADARRLRSPHGRVLALRRSSDTARRLFADGAEIARVCERDHAINGVTWWFELGDGVERGPYPSPRRAALAAAAMDEGELAYRAPLAPAAPRCGLHWSTAEVALLRTGLGRVSEQTLSVELGRGIPAIRQKANAIGLHHPGGRAHREGHCTCVSHLARPWNRPEHWTAAEIGYLEDHFGRLDDRAIARHLGRTAVGIRIKAKRLGLRKRDAGMTGLEVARLLGADPTVVSKVWIRRGLLGASRGFALGPNRVHLVSDEALERFICEHGQYVDWALVPVDSPFRDIVDAHRWYSLRDVHRLTGRHPSNIGPELVAGVFRAAKRGAHWYVPESELPRIRVTSHLAGEALAESLWRHEQRLTARRNRRKLASLRGAA